MAARLNKSGRQARGAAAIGVVFAAELGPQHSLFGVDAGEEREKQEDGEKDADRNASAQPTALTSNPR
jgi:hypothetical protein